MDHLSALLGRLYHGIADVIAAHWQWVVLAAVALLIVVVGTWLVRRKPGWLQHGPRRLGDWSLNLTRALRYLSTRREWRYRTPWVLLAGDPDAGKTSVIHSIEQGRRAGLLLRETKLAVADTEWAFFDGGVLIDIRDLDDAEPAKAARHWRAVLDDIDAQRPERPLDAVVLTLSAEVLLKPPPGGLEAVAERCYQRLFALQKRFSFTFPVYVLVTHCDTVDGFDAFWQAQPEAHRREMFGWSNPYTLNHRFDPTWVDTAFAGMRQDLLAAQLNAAARAEIADPDAFFLFPQRFSTLARPLATVLEMVFRPAAYHEDFLVRGIYFAGRVGGEPANPDKPSEDVAFVDHLFNARIFRERNLARPTNDGVWSRNRVLRRAQIALLAGTALALVGLSLTGLRLASQVDAAIVGFNAIQNPSQVLDTADGCDRGRVDAIYLLLSNLAQMDMDWTYPLIPASWFDEGVANAAARQIADRVFKEIVFPSLRCRLELKAQELVSANLSPVPRDVKGPSAEVAAARAQVVAYLDEVIGLQKALRDYTTISANSSGGSTAIQQAMLTVFADLAQYAYGQALPAPVRQRHGQQVRALGYITVTEEPKLPASFRERVSERLDARLAQARSVIDSRIAEGGQLAAAIEDDNLGVDVLRFTQWLGFAQRDWLNADRNANPCAQMVSATRPGITALENNFGYPVNLSDGLDRFTFKPAAAGTTGSTGCFIDALRGIQATSVAPYGSITVRVAQADGGSHLEIAPWVNPELQGLNAVQDLSFIDTPVTAAFTCEAPLRGWDGARLAEAGGYAHEYQAFREQRQLPTPQQVDADKKPLYDRLARRQLQRVLDDRVMRAQQPLTLADTASAMWLSPLSTGDERLGTRSRAFALTAPQLQKLLGLYAQFGMDAQAILACARSFANGELDAASRLAAASGLYEPDTQRDALAGQGGTQAGDTPYFDLGSPADTKQYLQNQLERAQVLAGYTEPFVRFLQSTPQPTVSGPDTKQGMTYWLATINEIDRYVQGKDPKGQVALLNDFVQKDLRDMGQANCVTGLTQAGGGADAADTDPSTGQGLFSARRSGLTAQAADYCTSGNQALAKGDYRSLAKRFNAELAGLFPFGPTGNADAPLAVAKRFFVDYAGERAALRAKVDAAAKSAGGARWERVATFLDELDAAADFLQATLAAGPKSQPLGVDVTFRYLAPEADPALGGGSQLIRWSFESGDATADYPNGDTTVNWRFGDPVALTLTWADLSSYRPQGDAAQGGLAVDERDARFSARGAWSLLRLIEEHRDDSPQAADPLNDQRVIAAFGIPVQLGSPPGTDKKDRAQVRLALDLVAADPSGKPGAQIALPTLFPSKAPSIW